jgi:hypothetical protein
MRYWPDWAEFRPPPPPAPARTPLRDIVLAALAEAFLTRRDTVFRLTSCTGCAPGRLCADHAEDLAAARVYEAAYARIAGYGSDGALLHALGGLT